MGATFIIAARYLKTTTLTTMIAGTCQLWQPGSLAKVGMAAIVVGKTRVSVVVSKVDAKLVTTLFATT